MVLLKTALIKSTFMRLCQIVAAMCRNFSALPKVQLELKCIPSEEVMSLANVFQVKFPKSSKEQDKTAAINSTVGRKLGQGEPLLHLNLCNTAVMYVKGFTYELF